MENLPDKGFTWPYCDRTLKHTWIGTLTMLWYWFPCQKNMAFYNKQHITKVNNNNSVLQSKLLNTRWQYLATACAKHFRPISLKSYGR